MLKSTLKLLTLSSQWLKVIFILNLGIRTIYTIFFY